MTHSSGLTHPSGDTGNTAPCKVGKVYLVGAGPGDPGLITLRGIECLRLAEFVLYDGLVNPLLLKHTHAQSERTCRVESPQGPTIQQAEINGRLIAAAKSGKTVVRLKGGDPYIFGRGSEEAEALAAEGIPFEVVPGITAATAAAVYSGLSLTHRSIASAVAFVTGHEDPDKTANQLDYRALANFPGTLVFYMGLHRIGQISSALISAGKPAETPVAVICRATTPQQRTVEGTLTTISERVVKAGLHPPSLVIVGECVRLRETTQWFENRPLFGLTIGVTRPEGQAQGAVDRIVELGGQPCLLPTVLISPPADWQQVDASIDALGIYQWVLFTSANGVDSFLGRLFERGLDARAFGAARLAAIGPATADSLRKYGLVPDVVPGEYRGEALAHELVQASQQSGTACRMLWVRANRGRDVIPAQLKAAGVTLDEVVAYRNDDVKEFSEAVRHQLALGTIDYIGLSSPSIARNFARLTAGRSVQPGDEGPRIVSISPVTTAAATEAGLVISAEAKDYTWDGILAAIVADRVAIKSRQATAP